MTEGSRSTVVTIFVLLSTIFGLYIGLGWALFGGIVELIKIFTSPLAIDPISVTINIFKILFCVPIGKIAGMLSVSVTLSITGIISHISEILRNE